MAALCNVAALLVLLCCLPGNRSLRLIDMSVPTMEVRGAHTCLMCGYNQDEAGDINVTWYKDGIEIYHIVNDAGKTINKVPGVEPDDFKSGFQYLCLKSLKVSSAGKYRCRAESVQNAVTSEEKYMAIFAPPTSDPVITGFQESVWVANGTLTVNCTAGKSFPAANITWSVDGQPADEQQLIRWPTEVDEEGLETSKLGLIIRLGASIVNEKVHVTCDAVIDKVYISRGDVYEATGFHEYRSDDLTITPFSAASQTRAGWTGALFLLLLLPVVAA